MTGERISTIIPFPLEIMGVVQEAIAARGV